MTNKEFARIIDKLQRKDIGALKILYEQFFQRIYMTAIGIINDKDDAYDIAMNVIEKLINYPSDPYAIKNHIGLLITMTRNEAYDFKRKQSHRINYVSFDETVISSSSDNLWIEDIINELDDTEERIFIEHCIWGKKLKEIAKESDMPYITVKRIYADIKSKIKKIYR
ncbi:MAG: RNA polymerase sigma factor [Candidatus Coproplasma sp.]